MSAKQAAVGVRPVRPGVWDLTACRGYRRDGGQRRLRERFEGTFSEAVARRQEMVAELGGSACAGQTDVVRDFWPLFMRRCRAKGLTNETIGGYESSWRLRIEPAFGNLRWPELSYPMVQSWVYGMTPAVAKKSVRCLKRMINCAVDAELVDRNVLDHRRIDYPVEREDPFAEQPVMWGAPQVAEAMRRLRGDDAEALFLALVGGGLRVEEGLGLMWSRLRFSEVSRLGGGDGLMAHAYVQMAWTERDGFKAPKNKFSRRVAPIPDPFASRLAELAVEGPRAFLWDKYPGRARKHWKALFEPGGALQGMPYAQLKDMRSVHETIMQGAGVLDTVNARLHGRTNVQTGYTHYLKPDAALDAAAQAFGRAVGGR